MTSMRGLEAVYLGGEHLEDSRESGPMTLVEVRKKAAERLKGTCGVYRVCDGSPDRLCQGQKFGGPIGLGGDGKGLAFRANVEALDRLKVRPRLISEHREPDMSATLFGQELAFPIMTSSMSGAKASMAGAITELDFALSMIQGARDAGTLGWVGNTAGEDPETTGIEAVRRVGAGVNIFKPQANDKIIHLMRKAEEAKAVAVGVDIDGFGSTIWARKGKPVYRKSVSDLRELADSTGLPFIVKGVMCPEDALDALDAGVSGIDVSNHGGRVLDSTRGVADVLPEVAEAVRGRAAITASGGIRTGVDVLKMLALGADAVLIGRDMIRAAIGGGPEGVKLHFGYLAGDLRRAMLLTSCNSLADIDGRVLYGAG